MAGRHSTPARKNAYAARMGDVRFLLGLARSGKTRMIHAEVVTELRRQPIGPPIYWVVPRQATFGIERWLACDSGLPGFSRVHVVAFDGFAREIEAQLGTGDGIPLDPIGRRLLITLAYGKVKDRLRVLVGNDRPIDWADSLSRLLAEFSFQQSPREERPLAERLSAAAESLQADTTKPNEALAAKLNDLALLETAYQSLLEDRNREDTTRRLNEAARKVDQLFDLAEARVYVDGFFTLSSFERSVLLVVARQAKQTTVALTMDPMAEAVHKLDRLSELDLFHQTLSTYRDLRVAMRTAEIGPVAVTQLTPSADLPADLALAELIARGGESAAKLRGNVVRLVEAPDVTAECQTVADEIAAAIRGGLRYRDALVLVPSIATYEQPLRLALEERNIPVEVDAADTEPQHELGRLIRTLISVATIGWTVDDVCELASAAGIADTFQAARLRGWLLWNPSAVTNISQLAWMDDANPLVGGELDPIRAKLVALLSPFTAAVTVSQSTFAPVGAGLFGVLTEVYKPWSKAEPAPQDTVLWQQWCDSLDSLAELAGSEAAPPKQWLELLEEATKLLKVALAPRSIDHVTISTPDRTRVDGVPLCVVMGASSGTGFESGGAELPGLSGEERQWLSTAGLLGSQHAAFRGVLDQRLVAYFGLTRWRNQLVVTRPLRLGKGRNLAATPWFTKLKKSGAECVTAVGAVIPSAKSLCSEMALEAGLLAWAGGNQKSDLALWAAAYDGLQAAGGRRLVRLVTASNAAGEFFGPSVPAASETAMMPTDLVLAARDIEVFLDCPFKYMVEKELGLKGTADRGEPADDWKTLLRNAGYRIGERAVREVVAEGEASEQLVKPAVAQAQARSNRAMSGEPGRDSHIVVLAQHSLGRALKSLTGWMKVAQTWTAELPASGGDLVSPVPLKTPAGHKLILKTRSFWAEEVQGKSTREIVFMDWAMSQPGAQRFDRMCVEDVVAEGIRIGIASQLLDSRGGGKGLDADGASVAGVAGHLRVNLRSTAKSYHSREYAIAKSPTVGNGAIGGWLKEALATDLAADLPEGLLHLRINQNGAPSANSMAVPDAAVAAVAAKTFALAARVADDVAGARRLAIPADKSIGLPCNHCQFRPVCRFDNRIQKPRKPSPEPVYELPAGEDEVEPAPTEGKK